MESKRDKEEKRIKDEFDLIQEGDRFKDRFDIDSHLATYENLPTLGEIDIYNYEEDLEMAAHKSIELLDSLVDLYFSEFPSEIKNHNYIKNRKREDALVYAETIFLQKMTRKNFIVQMRQVDNGDNSTRMHDVINNTIKEIRETSKFASTQRAEIEKSYRDFKNNLSDIIDRMKDINTDDKVDDDDNGKIIDPSKLNDIINEALASKRKNDDRNKL